MLVQNAGYDACWLLTKRVTHGMCFVVLHVFSSETKLTMARNYFVPQKDDASHIGTFGQIT